MITRAQADRLEADLVRRLRLATGEISSSVDMAELREAISNGDLEGVERALGLTDERNVLLIASVFFLMMRRTFEASIQATVDRYNYPADFSDQEWLKAATKEAAVRMLQQARATVRGIILRSMALGLSAAEIARRLVSWMWMLDRHASALEAQVQRMAEEEMPTSVIWRHATRVSAGYIMYRLILIASSETTRSKTQGFFRALMILILGGILSRLVNVRWVTAMDERVCPECAPLHGVVRPFFGAFPDGDPPLHGGCRCSLELA